MKAKDLMIGDWVQFHHKGVKKVSETPPMCKTVDVDYVGQIKGIYVDINNEKGDFAIKTLPNEYEKVIGLHMVRDFLINPIPLTAEILEKNGFDMADYTVHFKEDEHYMLEMVFEDDELRWTINCNEYTIMNFKYVHELQHALRLCGVEKEIIL